MPSISPEARARRRRRKLLLGATLATGAALWGARQTTSAGDDTDASEPTAEHPDREDDVEVRGEDKHDETLHDIWPG